MNGLERSLPSSPDSERAILGAILLENALINQARAALSPSQFYVASHRKIFEAMIALGDRRVNIDPVLINEECGEPTSHITNLTYGLPHSTNIEHYANVVREKAALRQLIKSAAKITEAALEEEDNAETIIANAESELFRLGLQARLSSKSTVRDYKEVAGSVKELLQAWTDGRIVAIQSQIPELDHKLVHGGLSPQELIVIAARTSFGKTALALQIALNSARAGIPVLIFSLEMSAEKVFIRNLSSTSNVPHFRISPWTFQNDRVTSQEILENVDKLQLLPIQVDDQTKQLRRMIGVARDWRRKKENVPALIITDYLQLVDNKLDKRSRQEEVAGISIELKRLAGELNVPIIGVSQLNRKPAMEHRRPEESDLRESGQVGQDADLILMPWSEDGLKDQPVRAMKLYCPKQRNGPTGWEIDIDFDGEHQWFYTAEMYEALRTDG